MSGPRFGSGQIQYNILQWNHFIKDTLGTANLIVDCREVNSSEVKNYRLYIIFGALESVLCREDIWCPLYSECPLIIGSLVYTCILWYVHSISNLIL